MQQDIQRVIDHVGLGIITSLKQDGQFYDLTTNQGRFVVCEASYTLDVVRQTQDTIDKSLLKKYGEATRVLMPDYTGKPTRDSSFVHQKDMFYSIYKLETQHTKKHA